MRAKIIKWKITVHTWSNLCNLSMTSDVLKTWINRFSGHCFWAKDVFIYDFVFSDLPHCKKEETIRISWYSVRDNNLSPFFIENSCGVQKHYSIVSQPSSEDVVVNWSSIFWPTELKWNAVQILIPIMLTGKLLEIFQQRIFIHVIKLCYEDIALLALVANILVWHGYQFLLITSFERRNWRKDTKCKTSFHISWIVFQYLRYICYSFQDVK